MISFPRFEGTSTIFRMLLIGEGLLLFSLAVSLGLYNLVAHDVQEEPFSSSEQEQFFLQHQRQFARFLDLQFPAETNFENESADFSPLTESLRRISEIQEALDSDNYQPAFELLSAFPEENPFNRSLLSIPRVRVFFHLGLYQELIDEVDNNDGFYSSQDRLLFMAARYRLGMTEDAFREFRSLFTGMSRHEFEPYLSEAELRDLMIRLDDDFWNHKMTTLLERGNRNAFRREIGQVKNRDLQSLLRAEYYYASRQYSIASRYLKEVRSREFGQRRDALQIKMDLRENRFIGILDRIRNLDSREAWYKKLVMDCAGMLYVRKEFQAAKVLFELYLGISEENESDHWRASWLGAWSARRLGEKDDYIRLLTYTARSGREGYRNAAMYWLARIAEENMEGLLEFPISFYAVHAFPEKERYSKFLEPFVDLFSREPSASLLIAIDEIRLLASLGLWSEARRHLIWVRNQSGLSASDRNSLSIIESLLFLRQERYLQAFNSYRTNFPGYQKMRLPVKLAGILFPIAFQEQILAAAKANDLDPFLLFALIRQESFFNVQAVSPQNAFGLMQIIMPTARQVLAGSGLPYKRLQRNDLFDPELNITLGCLYLRQLLKRYDNQLHLALAAYNAGPHRVDRWLEDFSTDDEILFIEQIPFTETRNYVKTILRNLFYYRFYYQDLSPAISDTAEPQ